MRFNLTAVKMRLRDEITLGLLNDVSLDDPIRDRLYTIHRSMKERCHNENHIAFRRYGGRGIKVCADWQEFEPFREWALANGYAEGLTIDREDNDQGYSPGNCRWSTRQEQARNRSNSITVTGPDGLQSTLLDLSRALQVSYSTLYRRHAAGKVGQDLWGG